MRALVVALIFWGFCGSTAHAFDADSVKARRDLAREISLAINKAESVGTVTPAQAGFMRAADLRLIKDILLSKLEDWSFDELRVMEKGLRCLQAHLGSSAVMEDARGYFAQKIGASAQVACKVEKHESKG